MTSPKLPEVVRRVLGLLSAPERRDEALRSVAAHALCTFA
jgi:hypothetical protein